MALVETRDKARLQEFLEEHRALNAYAIGDLDEPFWPRTDWFTWVENDEIKEVALLYKGFDPPILLALQNNSVEGMQSLVAELSGRLPDHVYAHLTPGLSEILEREFDLQDHGEHFTMEKKKTLAAKTLRSAQSEPEVERLTKEKVTEVEEFFDASYPGHWFRPDMLEMGPYFGIRDGDGHLVAAGGVHIFSEKYQVAALGNITTHPSQRGRGYGKRVTQSLCNFLTGKVKTIGLNVQSNNPAAIKIYGDLGFEPITTYSEYTLKRRSAK